MKSKISLDLVGNSRFYR